MGLYDVKPGGFYDLASPGGFLLDANVELRGAPGSKGATVKVIQDLLNYFSAKPPLVDDGDYGPLTTQAVRDFQTANALQVDGIVGPQTSRALNDSESKDIGGSRSSSPSKVRSWKKPALIAAGVVGAGVAYVKRDAIRAFFKSKKKGTTT